MYAVQAVLITAGTKCRLHPVSYTHLALETDSTEEILNAGETVLTSASTESEECVAQVKLGREQVRSKNKEDVYKRQGVPLCKKDRHST